MEQPAVDFLKRCSAFSKRVSRLVLGLAVVNKIKHLAYPGHKFELPNVITPRLRQREHHPSMAIEHHPNLCLCAAILLILTRVTHPNAPAPHRHRRQILPRIQFIPAGVSRVREGVLCCRGSPTAKFKACVAVTFFSTLFL